MRDHRPPLHLINGPFEVNLVLSLAFPISLVTPLEKMFSPTRNRWSKWAELTKLDIEAVPLRDPIPAGSKHFIEVDGGLHFVGIRSLLRLDSEPLILSIDPSEDLSRLLDQLRLGLIVSTLVTLIRRGLGVIMHASASAIDDRGMAFAGASGVGKSTLATRLGAVSRLSDDLTILLRTPMSGWIVGGLRGWQADPLPLHTLFFLGRGEATTVGPHLPVGQAMRRTIRNTVWYPGCPTLDESILDLLHKFVAEIPCRELQVSLNDLSQAPFRQAALR